MGIQHGWPSIRGAELSPAEMLEPRAFSLYLQALSGVSKSPPLPAASWLNKSGSGRWGLSALWGVTARRHRHAMGSWGSLSRKDPHLAVQFHHGVVLQAG